MEDNINNTFLNGTCSTYASYYRYCPNMGQWIICNIEKCPYEKAKEAIELIDKINELIEELKKLNNVPYCPYPYVPCPTYPYPTVPCPTYPYPSPYWDFPTVTEIIPDRMPLVTYCLNY